MTEKLFEELRNNLEYQFDRRGAAIIKL